MGTNYLSIVLLGTFSAKPGVTGIDPKKLFLGLVNISGLIPVPNCFRSLVIAGGVLEGMAT